MLLLDLSHTSHTRARTGIQRVARSLWRELGPRACAVCFDPHQKSWRALDPWERALLEAEGTFETRRARWPLGARLRGWRRRLGRAALPAGLPAPSGVLVPEIFSPAAGAALPRLFALARGPAAAVFHDAIALQLPELTPAKSVARFPGYLRELLAFDGVAAISEASRQALLDHWRATGANDPPPVAVIPLGIDPPKESLNRGISAAPPVILCVATIEGRKNHLALLEACERLWAAGTRFELRLAGLARPETARPALERIAALQRAGRPLRYDGPADDAVLDAAYHAAAFTVYPSLMEGFGLPVLESLARGTPCVCSGLGALGESTRGGGCLALEAVGAAALGAAIGRLLGDSALLERLRAEARARPIRTWADYARDLADWLGTLQKR